MEDSLLGVVIDVELRVLPGEPDQDVVGAVDVGVLHVPPTLHVLKHDSFMLAEKCTKWPLKESLVE